EALDLSEVAASGPWTQLRKLLSQATGERFAVARPRRDASASGDGAGSFLRVETETGPEMVPAAVRRRLADLVAAGRLPVLVASGRLRCVVIDTRAWHRQLQAMADAIHSGAIDPATTSIDAPAAADALRACPLPSGATWGPPPSPSCGRFPPRPPGSLPCRRALAMPRKRKRSSHGFQQPRHLHRSAHR